MLSYADAFMHEATAIQHNHSSTNLTEMTSSFEQVPAKTTSFSMMHTL
jgi:hypothetical protein